MFHQIQVHVSPDQLSTSEVMPALTATERSHRFRAKVWNDDQEHKAAKAKDRDRKKQQRAFKKATMTEREKNEKKQKEREAKQWQ